MGTVKLNLKNVPFPLRGECSAKSSLVLELRTELDTLKLFLKSLRLERAVERKQCFFLGRGRPGLTKLNDNFGEFTNTPAPLTIFDIGKRNKGHAIEKNMLLFLSSWSSSRVISGKVNWKKRGIYSFLVHL